MADNKDYIRVNDLIKDRRSSKNADILTERIKISNFPEIVVDWEDSGTMDAAFVDAYLYGLRGFCGSNKRIINQKLPESALNYILPFIVDKSENEIFRYVQ